MATPSGVVLNKARVTTGDGYYYQYKHNPGAKRTSRRTQRQTERPTKAAAGRSTLILTSRTSDTGLPCSPSYLFDPRIGPRNGHHDAVLPSPPPER